MKLWEKGYELDSRVEAFMTSDDPLLDEALVVYDCMGSIAHAKMLFKIKILTQDECDRLTLELCALSQEGQLNIKPADEDVHTAIENALIARLGEVGKKIHTARSRNDQVLLDLRLYCREEIVKSVQCILEASETLLAFATKHKDTPIPGRTHFQRAMPSSLGLWGAAFAESLLDDCELFKTAYTLVDQCPLGSAASYGVALNIDRQYVADLLGFSKVQNNVLYVNNSRGKFEAIILNALVQVMNDLAKIATDIIIFCSPEFGYFHLPDKYCPGSSLMPQKRNPCPFELIRAKSATLQSYLIHVLETVRALPSGYNRDFQETKRPLMRGFETTFLSLKAFAQMIGDLKVDRKRCASAFSDELFATDEVLKRVEKGVAFRKAYEQVARHPKCVSRQDPTENILGKTHLGATGNLGLHLSREKLQQYHLWCNRLQQKLKEVQIKLLGL